MEKIENVRQKSSVPKILNLIYPPTCGVCGKLNSDFLCKKCEKVLETEAIYGVDRYKNFSKENKIKKEIKRKIKQNKNLEIGSENRDKKYFNEHLYIFEYEGIIRRIILKYKFQDKAYLYKTFVNFLLKNKNFFEFIKKYDTIIPVPINRKRRALRGYNQSELIAKEIASFSNLKMETNCLFKIKDVIEQSKLNKEERQKNIQGVYELRNKEKLYKKKILLVDDIYTTGSTVNECSKVLRGAKPKQIGIFTIAKD